MRRYYTDYPRTLLWLVRGGTVVIGGPEAGSSPPFSAAVGSFYISKVPITNEQFEAFDPEFVRSPVADNDQDPAVGVTFHECAAYAEWYAGVSRKKMRLPTEIEWEYACRAESSSIYYFGDSADRADEFMWDVRNSGNRIPPLDQKKPNEFGLYGMLGGVWEWTSSPARRYPPGDSQGQADPQDRRVLRGGSFRTDRSQISCSVRRTESPDSRSDEFGFRLVRSFRET